MTMGNNGTGDKMTPNQSEFPTRCDHNAEVSKLVESAYTEGYTQAEAKYRKMWDEMQANIKEKAFGKRKGLIHTADIDAMPTIEPERKTGKWIHDGEAFDGGIDWMHCSECGHKDVWCNAGRTPYCPNCGARMEVEHE